MKKLLRLLSISLLATVLSSSFTFAIEDDMGGEPGGNSHNPIATFSINP